MSGISSQLWQFQAGRSQTTGYKSSLLSSAKAKHGHTVVSSFFILNIETKKALSQNFNIGYFLNPAESVVFLIFVFTYICGVLPYSTLCNQRSKIWLIPMVGEQQVPGRICCPDSEATAWGSSSFSRCSTVCSRVKGTPSPHTPPHPPSSAWPQCPQRAVALKCN